MKYSSWAFALSMVFYLSCFCMSARADIILAEHGQSSYTIVIPAAPPQSVSAAAKELERDIEKATGAKLPIVKDTAKTPAHFISLGLTKQAKAASIKIKDITPGGFRIVTRGGNLYIRGLDTVAKVNWSRKHWGDMTPQPNIPGPQYTKNGGFSNGSANGVYIFLEKRLGVRWLMPGAIGLVVPQTQVFKIPEINRVDEPMFIYRNLIDLQKWPQNLTSVKKWQVHQKLGFSFRMNFNHNLWATLNGGKSHSVNTAEIRKLYKEHPKWFAMNDKGKRPAPKSQYNKVETTNQQLVKYFADQAIKAFKKNPHQNTYSLSLSDGRGYSKSPESKALKDPPPPGSSHPSVTRMVLKWYRDIAQIVAQKEPNAKLSGYLYQQYLFPPAHGSMKFPDNFIPMIAMSIDYGYTLYRRENRKLFEQVMSGWAKVAPSKWMYFDLPNQIISGQANGMVTPPATNILNFIFPRLLKYHIKGSLFFGNTSWSQAALTNYIDARLLWNPSLNADKIKQDWLVNAYGANAAKIMDNFYDQLSGWFAAYWQTHHSARLHVWEETFEKLFAPHYAQMEHIYLKALAQPMTDKQKRRLKLIGYNLSVLQWRLKNGGYIAANYHSPLTLSNEQIAKLLFPTNKPTWQVPEKKRKYPFDLFPVLWYQHKPKQTRTTVKLSSMPASAAPSADGKLPNSGFIMFYPTKDMTITIHPKSVKPLSSFLGYQIYTPFGRAKWSMLTQGLLYTNGSITIKAKANTPYYLSIVPQGITPQIKEAADVRYVLHIPRAALAQASYEKKTLALHPVKNKTSNLYVYAPTAMHLSASQTSSGEVILGTQSRADGTRQAFLSKHTDLRVVKKLDNHWRFHKDKEQAGLQKGFTKPGFDDSSWKTVSATAHWQEQGFPNYQGTAWYRKTITLTKAQAGRRSWLFFGAVDGDAAIYVNGHRVGAHKLGKHGKGWDASFSVKVTGALHEGKNTVAVRVTKTSHVGGIYKGVALVQND